MLGLEQEKRGEGIEFWVHFEGRVETTNTVTMVGERGTQR